MTVAYHRDRKEKWKDTKYEIYKDLNDYGNYLKDSWLEYAYLYDLTSERWMWLEYPFDNLELRDLKESLIDKCIIENDIKI